jgi:hypothetical protein
MATYFLFAFTACLRPNDCSLRPGSMEMGFRCSPSLVSPPFTLRHLTYATSCRTNGLQLKLVGTAINGNLGPDYMHLSIPSRPHYLPLRLQSAARDCNQGDQDHIKCNYSGSPSSPCLYAREGACDSRERLGGAAVSFPFRLGSVSVSPRVNPPC